MDYVPFIGNAVQCLAGVIGVEPVNPTCVAWGFPSVGYLTQFLTWGPVTLMAGFVFGGAIVVWMMWKLWDILGMFV